MLTFFAGLGGMAMVAAWWGIWDILAGLLLAAWWRKRDARAGNHAAPAAAPDGADR